MNNRSLLSVLIVTLSLYRSYALYEDQIGKFDWKKEFVGEVKFSKFDNGINFHETVYVATEQNVIAALSLKNGDIKWRNVLEKGDGGVIKSLNIVNNVIFVVSGNEVVIIRGWNAKYGYLTHQWSLLQNESEEPQQLLWLAHDIYLYKVAIKLNNIQIINYKIFNGEKLAEKTIQAAVSAKDKCSISKTTLLCLNELGQLVLVNLTQTSESNGDSSPSIEIPEDEKLYNVRASPNNDKSSFIVSTDDKNIFYTHSNESSFELLDSITVKGDIHIQCLDLGTSTLEITAEPVSKTELLVSGYFLNPKQTAFSHRYVLKQPIGSVIISNADCYKKPTGIVSCALLLSSSDGALIFLNSPGKLEWIREEGLSSIVTVEFIELPMSDTEAEMQTEFDAKESDVLNMFTRRISSHVFQLQKFILGLSGIFEKSFSVESNENKLVRDYFNLHKIILLITKHLKIYAVDNISKEIHWSYLLDKNYEPFPAPSEDFEVRVPLFIQRTYRHYPHPMQCTLLVRRKGTQNGVIISFNPVTGKFETPIELNYKIKQTMLIPKTTSEDYLQGIILMDDNDGIHAYPERTLPILKEVSEKLYFYTANAETCDIQGYAFNGDNTNMKMTPTWNMQCSGKIVKISGKNPIEKVHSQGRVLADRSVLYKYINPNLIAVVSQSINPEDQKSMLKLYLIDSVTGAFVSGDVRYRASDPVHLVHSENWVVLMYFNHKTRRTEVVTYELYEGKAQNNSRVFSSIETRNLRPIVDSRAYILPTSFIEAAKETITEKGITSKHVLVALSTGNVVELPWVILDPRRPFAATPETKEEGVIPYMPEIPIPTEAMINYNRTLHRTRGMITSPSGLESTCLVFVYGLDLFYTRTAPSKTFDLLKEDFDYTLIIIVLVLLIIATFITKHFAYKRALRQAWR